MKATTTEQTAMKFGCEKKIKVGSLARKKSKYSGEYKFLPKLLLTGNWLNDAGFTVGDSVNVYAQENKIVIEKPEAEPTLIDEFCEHLNSIYFDGYAQELQTSSPRLFNFEYEQFLKIYRF